MINTTHCAVAKSSRKKTKRNTRRNLALLRKTRLLADKRAKARRMEERS